MFICSHDPGRRINQMACSWMFACGKEAVKRSGECGAVVCLCACAICSGVTGANEGQ